MLIADKLISQHRRGSFCALRLVGGIGLFVHMSVLWFALTVAGAAFNAVQASAAIVAMTSNFFVNNFFTYRDRRLRGFALVWEAVHLVCDLRPRRVANVGIAG
jgi:dolichol-phosphate mannosyltransferase